MNYFSLDFDEKVKPFVRANKRMSRKPSDRQQYQEFKTCKELIAIKAKEAINTVDTIQALPAKTPFYIVLLFRVPTLFTSDLDNMVKTVLDGLVKAEVTADDRYCVAKFALKELNKDDPGVFIQATTDAIFFSRSVAAWLSAENLFSAH